MSWFIEEVSNSGRVLRRVELTDPKYSINFNNTTNNFNVSLDSNTTHIITIGRDLSCDFILDDVHVAPIHAKVLINDKNEAFIEDINTLNGIIYKKKKLKFKNNNQEPILTDDPYKLGKTQLRIRNSAWEIPKEKALSPKSAVPYALMGLISVLMYITYTLWVGDTGDSTPHYLYDLSAFTLLFCVWSSFYAVFGRLISGEDRFFTHLTIATTGYLIGVLVVNTLDLLAFAFSSLIPLYIAPYVSIIILAMIVKTHLKLADPIHWKYERFALLLVTVMAISVPLAQNYISHKKFTDIQTLSTLKHPTLMVVPPVSIDDYINKNNTLKSQLDQKKKDNLLNNIVDQIEATSDDKED